MRHHAFPHERQARNIDVMAPGSQRRLRDGILQLRHRPATVHGTAAAKFLQRARIADIDSYRRYCRTKVRCNSLQVGNIASTDEDCFIRGRSKLLRNGFPRAAGAAYDTESGSAVHRSADERSIQV
jgi:hypothetical protein